MLGHTDTATAAAEIKTRPKGSLLLRHTFRIPARMARCVHATFYQFYAGRPAGQRPFYSIGPTSLGGDTFTPEPAARPQCDQHQVARPPQDSIVTEPPFREGLMGTDQYRQRPIRVSTRAIRTFDQLESAAMLAVEGAPIEDRTGREAPRF